MPSLPRADARPFWELRLITGPLSRSGAALLTTLATMSLASAALGDSWVMPSERTYTSPSGFYELDVTPGKFGSQLEYFSGEPAASTPTARLHRTQENLPRVLISSFDLDNEVSPVSALVADGGDYIVTFDNWHEVGYGDNVVVIYRRDGSIVRKLALSDFLTQTDIERLTHSVSSIWWSGEHRLEPEHDRLVLQVLACEGSRDCDEVIELGIELSSGDLLQSKENRLSSRHLIDSDGKALDSEPDQP